MSCNITDNILLDCIDSIGGVKTVYVGTDIVISTVVAGTAGILTGGTGTGTFYEFQIPKNTSSYTETLTIAPEAGTLFYQQDVALVFNKMESAKRDQLLLLAKNRDIKVIVEDSNAKFWLIGYSRGAQISAGGAASGVAPGDTNGYTLTISGQEPLPAYELASTGIFSGVTVTPA